MHQKTLKYHVFWSLMIEKSKLRVIIVINILYVVKVSWRDKTISQGPTSKVSKVSPGPNIIMRAFPLIT
jgi:hypothetical protein